MISTVIWRQVRSRKVWLLGGGLLFLVLCGAYLGVGYPYLVRQGAFNCTPSDFPRYPGETVQNVNRSFFFSAAGCTMTLNEPAAADHVEAFYNETLQKPPYELDGYDADTGTFTFTRALGEDGQAHGYLTVEGHGQSTTVEVVVDSP